MHLWPRLTISPRMMKMMSLSSWRWGKKRAQLLLRWPRSQRFTSRIVKRWGRYSEKNRSAYPVIRIFQLLEHFLSQTLWIWFSVGLVGSSSNAPLRPLCGSMSFKVSFWYQWDYGTVCDFILANNTNMLSHAVSKIPQISSQLLLLMGCLTSTHSFGVNP